MRAEQLVVDFPVVDIDSPSRDAVRLLAEQRLTGLVVRTGRCDKPYAVLPASQVVRFLIPGYVQDDPALARIMTESMADHAAEKLSGKTIRDLLPKKAQQVPAVDADDTIVEVAEIMSRMHCPLVIVLRGGELFGVITASHLLAEAVKM